MLKKYEIEKVAERYQNHYEYVKTVQKYPGIWHIMYDIGSPVAQPMDLNKIGEELNAETIWMPFGEGDGYYTTILLIENWVLDDLFNYEYDGLMTFTLKRVIEAKYPVEFNNVFYENKNEALHKIKSEMSKLNHHKAWKLACSVTNKMDFKSGMCIINNTFVVPTWNEAVQMIKEEQETLKSETKPIYFDKNEKLTWQLPEQICEELGLEEGDILEYRGSIFQDFEIWKKQT